MEFLILNILILLVIGIMKFIKKKKINYSLLIKIYAVIILIQIGTLLTFHFVLDDDNFIVRRFSKNGLSFNKTFITQKDLRTIKSDYENAGIFFKTQTLNDPFVKLLMENKVLLDGNDYGLKGQLLDYNEALNYLPLNK